LALPLCAQAITVGGIEFDDSAFAESFVSTSDGFSYDFLGADSADITVFGTLNGVNIATVPL